MKLAVFSIFFCFFLQSAQAQSWYENHERAAKLYQADSIQEAMQLGIRNLSIIRQEQSTESEAYAKALRLLSLMSYSSAWYDKGLNYSLQEVALRRRLHEEAQHSDADAIYNLSLIQLKLEKFSEAAENLQQALSIYQNYLQTDTLFQLHLHLTDAYLNSGNIQEAGLHLEKTLQTLEKFDGLAYLKGIAHYLQYKLLQNDNQEASLGNLEKAYEYFQKDEVKANSMPEYIDILETLARQHQKNLRLAEARDLYYELHLILDQQPQKDSLKWAGVLNNLGSLSVKSEPASAAAWLKKAFEIYEAVADHQSQAFWSALDNYAMSLYRQGDSEQALALYEQYTIWMKDTTESATFATAMNNHALILRDKGKMQEALHCLYRAEKLHTHMHEGTSRREHLKLATIYYNLAQTHQALSQYDTAIFYYKRSTEVSKQAQAMQSPEYLAAINGMAGLYHDIGYYTEADIFYTEALRIQESLDGKPSNTYASILSNHALLYQDKGDFRKAEELLEEALETKRKLLGLDHPEYISVLSNMGLLFLEQANYEEARRLLETVLIKYENLYGKNHAQLAYSLNNLARLETATGNYPDAEPLLKQALEIQENNHGKSHPAYAVTAVELGNFYMLLGNYEAAAPLLNQSRQLLRERYGEKHPSYATATQNLAVLAEARGNLEQAESYLLETLEIDRYTLGRQNPKYAVTLNNLASFYQNNDSLSKAMPLLEEALAICQNVLGKEHPLYTSTLLNLALLYQDLQEYQKAEPLISEVVVLRKQLLGDLHPEYAYALYGNAVNAYRLGNYPEAIQLFQQVIRLYAWQIKEYFPALSEKEKSAFYQRIEPVLNTYRDFVISLNLKEDEVNELEKNTLLGSLYDIQLLTKAMLLDASSKIRRNIFQSGDPQLIELYEQWQGLKEQLAKYYSLSERELKTGGINLQTLESDANELEKKLADGSRLFAQSLLNQELRWTDVKNQLQEDEAALEIIRVKNEASEQIFYTALILDASHEAPRMVILPKGQDMEIKNFNYYKNAIAFRIEDELSYNLYWRPISNALGEGVRTVYVAPDGVYNKISLNSLYNTDKGIFLLDEVNLRMLSSTRELTDPARTETHSGLNALLLGFPDYSATDQKNYLAEAKQGGLGSEIQSSDIQGFTVTTSKSYDFHPLPGTKREVDNIEDIMQRNNWYIEKLTGRAASEENVKQLVMPHVLHIATHGYFLSDLPVEKDQKAFGIHMQNVEANPLLRSGLLLAGAARKLQYVDSLYLETEDGVLTAYEAMNLNLNGTDLVVLSACETALGEVKNGEGVYGLQRAFLVAGANSVLMSLWKVNDESTTEMIRLFYENWLSGQDKFSALANAQRKIREKYEEPYHWAPFVLIGT